MCVVVVVVFLMDRPIKYSTKKNLTGTKTTTIKYEEGFDFDETIIIALENCS